ncbi:MAG TPA: hypothetical protein VMB24_00340 [Dehalococcoidales bacterium]|nr:hypothetical protein [Dehalococcoidales bacterium]
MARKNNEEKPREFTRRQISHAKKQGRRQKIILYSGIAVLVAAIVLPLVGWFASEYVPMHRTVMIVGNEKFSMGEYLDTMKIIRKLYPTVETSQIVQAGIQTMSQGKIIEVGAASLNVTASDESVKSFLKTSGLPETKAYLEYYRQQIILQQLQSGYFGSQVPETADLVHPLMMMLESDQQAAEVRQQLVNGANFTEIAPLLGQDYYSKSMNQGDFGLHPRDILKDQVSSAIPLDYAFSADVGSLSPPLTDNATNKQSGYWLIDIAQRAASDNETINAIFVSDNATATNVRNQLVAGGSLSALADQYTQYSLSKNGHGDLGVVMLSDNSTYTQAFNSYAWDPSSPVGVWSQPIHDSELWTVGGSWLVKVLDKQINAKVSDDDRKTLISGLIDDWYKTISNSPDLVVNTDMLTPEIQNWAAARLDKEMPAQLTQ